MVTDVAARGIDIPLLDNVINYNFPGKPKLFVHRVGKLHKTEQSGWLCFLSFIHCRLRVMGMQRQAILCFNNKMVY